MAYTSGDPVALAKALSTWVKDNAEFTFKLGIIDGKVITVEEVNQLATMPGKEELYAKLLFLISSPAQRLATVINATGRDLAVVINQGVEKEEFVAGATPAAEAKTETLASAGESAQAAEATATPVEGAVSAEPTISADSAQTEAAASEAPAEGSTEERGAE